MDANLLVTRGRTIIEGERRKRRRLSGEAALPQQLARGEETFPGAQDEAAFEAAADAVQEQLQSHRRTLARTSPRDRPCLYDRHATPSDGPHRGSPSRARYERSGSVRGRSGTVREHSPANVTVPTSDVCSRVFGFGLGCVSIAQILALMCTVMLKIAVTIHISLRPPAYRIRDVTVGVPDTAIGRTPQWQFCLGVVRWTRAQPSRRGHDRLVEPRHSVAANRDRAAWAVVPQSRLVLARRQRHNWKRAAKAAFKARVSVAATCPPQGQHGATQPAVTCVPKTSTTTTTGGVGR